MTNRMEYRVLIDKIRNLSPERFAEVEHFVDFLAARDGDGQSARLAARASEAAFGAVWDNAEDADYDRL